MSECVVRMEMPHDGLCDLAYSFLNRTVCTIEGNLCNYCDDEVRPDWCPIICVLPEKHGDLIERDETFHAAKPKECSDEHWAETTLGRVVLEAKTIVPATEGGKE